VPPGAVPLAAFPSFPEGSCSNIFRFTSLALLCLAACSLAHAAAAQTNGISSSATNTTGLWANGTEYLHVGSTGNVGIGTTSPNTTLQVNGSIMMSTGTCGSSTAGSIQWNGSALQYCNGSTWTTLAAGIGGSGTTNYLARWTPNGTTLGIGATYDNGTDVGIGTTVPLSPLETSAGNNTSNVYTTTLANVAFSIYGTNTLNVSNITSLGGSTGGNVDDVIFTPAAASSSLVTARLSHAYIPAASSYGTTSSLYGDVSEAETYASSALGSMYGVQGIARTYGTGTITNAYGGNFTAGATSNSNQTVTVSNSYGVYSSSPNTTTGGTIDYQYGVYATASNSGTVQNGYGVYITGFATGGTHSNTPFDVYAADSGTYNYFAGNVGIGTTVPQGVLDVDGGSGSGIAVRQTGAPSSSFTLAGLYLGGTGSYGWLQASGSSSNNPLVLNPNGGNVGIGTTTPAANGLTINSVSPTLTFELSGTSEEYLNDDGSYFYVISTSGGNGVKLQHGSTLWTSSSDRRIKKDIAALPESYGLSAVERLKPVTFHWRDPKSPQQLQMGLIAQDVQQVIPELVTRSGPTRYAPDGELGIEYSGLVIPLIKAIQELKADNDDLRTIIAREEAEIADLRREVRAQ
jgi:hypothetical protein